MRIFIIFSVLLLSASAHAGINKCIVNGKTTYQASPCPDDESKFKLKRDISEQKQAEAKTKLANVLADSAEKKRIDREIVDMERVIYAEERKGDAAYSQAKQQNARLRRWNIRTGLG